MTAKKTLAGEMLHRAYTVSSEEETRALYQDWAENYDAIMMDELDYLTPSRTASLLQKHLPDRSVPVLDVGSGTGLAGEHLAEFGFGTIDALDYMPAMLALAKRRKVKSRAVYRKTIEADLNKDLALPDNAYRAMICTGTFTHAHVNADCLDELFRVLKPGGLFACTIHKDVWQEGGFAHKADQLTEQNMLETVSMEMGKYFGTDNEPQGWFILWEKPA